MIKGILAVARYDNKYLIGDGDKLPWHVPTDLKYFKDITKDCIVVLGKRTYDTLGKKLKQRDIVVFGRTKGTDKNVRYITSVDEMKTFLTAEHEKDVFIAGGAKVIELFGSYISMFYISLINKHLVETPKKPVYVKFNHNDYIEQVLDRYEHFTVFRFIKR